MQYNIRKRLFELRKKQKDLLMELHNRHIVVTASQLSRYVNGVENPPKSDLVLSEADKIVTGWEKSHDA